MISIIDYIVHVALVLSAVAVFSLSALLITAQVYKTGKRIIRKSPEWIVSIGWITCIVLINVIAYFTH